MLESDTHRLRAMELRDVEFLFDIENQSDEWWLGSNLSPISRETLNAFVTGQHDLWRDLQLRLILEHKDTGDQVGAVDLYQLDPRNRRAGVGIVIRRSHRMQGHAQAGLALMMDYAFGHLGLHQLWAEVPAGLESSERLFKGAGFETNGTMKSWILKDDHWMDALWMQKMKP